MKPLTEENMTALLRAVVSQIMTQQTELVIVTSPYTEFPSDFPWIRKKVRVDDLVHNSVNAKAVFYWMVKHGHTDLTMDKLRVAQILHTKKEKELFGE